MFIVFTLFICIINVTIFFMINIFKLLIISLLCLIVMCCKTKSNTSVKTKLERTNTTDDLRDEQMDEYELEMRDQNNY